MGFEFEYDVVFQANPSLIACWPQCPVLLAKLSVCTRGKVCQKDTSKFGTKLGHKY
jgi:hypothetical protein